MKKSIQMKNMLIILLGRIRPLLLQLLLLMMMILCCAFAVKMEAFVA
jgi:hypothetical protein